MITYRHQDVTIPTAADDATVVPREPLRARREVVLADHRPCRVGIADPRYAEK
jgi:hypothetical protein